MVEKKGEVDEKIESSIKVHSTKSPQYRTIHVDGAMLGMVPNSLIELQLFSLHSSVPLDVTYQIEDGQIGEEIAQTTQGGLVREIECAAIMDLNQAETIAKLMLEFVDKKRKALHGVD